MDILFQDSDANLASSTLISQGQNPNDVLGIAISYSARVALNCGAMGGELVADLPFKLVHPSPSSKYIFWLMWKISLWKIKLNNYRAIYFL